MTSDGASSVFPQRDHRSGTAPLYQKGAHASAGYWWTFVASATGPALLTLIWASTEAAGTDLGVGPAGPVLLVWTGAAVVFFLPFGAYASRHRQADGKRDYRRLIGVLILGSQAVTLVTYFFLNFGEVRTALAMLAAAALLATWWGITALRGRSHA